MKAFRPLINVALLLLGTILQAADWPMWRYDAARSAASPEALPTNLTLLWSRQLPPVRQAWPLEPNQRLNFDASYEPVVLGNIMLLGSPNDGSVTAYDTGTGAERWKVFTEGPVRCAPACWSNRVYVGSDDGWLYCLEAGTGRELWKVRGAPSDRPDRRQIGNGHLVSFWPVRGGPVVADGVVYFAAGIWPIFGVFVHALDTATGRVKWSNGELHYLTNVRIDHDRRYLSGLSPQGHLLAVGERLVVPCGRSLPAGLDRNTGRLIYYVQGYRNGDSRVAAHGEYAFVGKQAVVSLYDFREIGSRWVGRGTNAPPPGQRGDPSLLECPYLGGILNPPYKLAAACDAASAFADGVAYGAAGGTFYAYDVQQTKPADKDAEIGGRTVRTLRWEPRKLWELPTPYTGQRSGVTIKAGPRIYSNSGRRLLAVDVQETPRVVWDYDLEGTPSSLVAADGKLLVVTAEGGLYCFGRPPSSVAADVSIRQRTGTAAATVEPGAAGPEQGRGAEIVKVTGVTSGYCLVLGLSDGRLIEELLSGTDLIMLGVDADAGKVNRLRRAFDAAGVYGTRVELFVGDPADFPFPPYLASLIVSEDGAAAGLPGKADASKLFNILRPYGGTLCLLGAGGDFDSWARGVTAANARVRRVGEAALLVREGPLPGSAPWTHEAADAANTFCSADERVRAPLGVLWYGDQTGVRQYHDYGIGVKPLVAGGRVFVLERRSTAPLSVYDAYTGRLLWRRELKVVQPRFAVTTDALYVAATGQCLVCDPATGQTLQTWPFDKGTAPVAKAIRVDGETLLIACSDQAEAEIQKGYFDATTLVCLDRRTGAERWRRQAADRFNQAGIALGTGLVFCVDSVSMVRNERWQKRTAGVAETESVVLALDAQTGAERWSRRFRYPYQSYGPEGGVYLVSRDDWLGYSAEHNLLLWGRNRRAAGMNAQTGALLWEQPQVGEAPMILRGRTFINQGPERWNGTTAGQVYDLFTGQLLSERPLMCIAGCNYMTGSRHVVLVRDQTASYGDIDRGRQYHLRNIRSGCSNSLIPADGLVNVPNFAMDCVCNYAIETSFALAPMPEVEAWMGTTPVPVVPPPPKAD